MTIPEILNVLHVDSRPHDVVNPRPGGREDLPQVGEDELGLVLHPPGQLPGVELHPDLAGDVEGVVDPDRLAQRRLGDGRSGCLIKHSPMSLPHSGGPSTSTVYSLRIKTNLFLTTNVSKKFYSFQLFPDLLFIRHFPRTMT